MGEEGTPQQQDPLPLGVWGSAPFGLHRQPACPPKASSCQEAAPGGGVAVDPHPTQTPSHTRLSHPAISSSQCRKLPPCLGQGLLSLIFLIFEMRASFRTLVDQAQSTPGPAFRLSQWPPSDASGCTQDVTTPIACCPSFAPGLQHPTLFGGALPCANHMSGISSNLAKCCRSCCPCLDFLVHIFHFQNFPGRI